MNEEIDKMDTMLRIALKGKLIKDCNEIFEKNDKYRLCHSKRFHKKVGRSIYKDFKAGLAEINEKVPVFIELPKYEKVGKNEYSVTSSETVKKEFVIPEKKTDKKPKVIDSFKVDFLEFTPDDKKKK